MTERGLIDALRNREEQAFLALVEQHHSSLVRLAISYVRSREVAEEVVQETWLAVLKGIDGFEGRSSLKTWILSILMNQARTVGRRESKHSSFAAEFDPNSEGAEPAVDPGRFHRVDDPAMDGHWSRPPIDWAGDPERELLTREALEFVEQVVAQLPPSQREVITLRDIEGCTAPEVCNMLAITETNQRVLLHRARSKVRTTLAWYMKED